VSTEDVSAYAMGTWTSALRVIGGVRVENTRSTPPATHRRGRQRQVVHAGQVRASQTTPTCCRACTCATTRRRLGAALLGQQDGLAPGFGAIAPPGDEQQRQEVAPGQPDLAVRVANIDLSVEKYIGKSGILSLGCSTSRSTATSSASSSTMPRPTAATT
jgi:hypothetical protein